ncbi:hypothetical protein H2201_000895 [Coniosporium apollinis]|uniref:DUF6594 domain-containing protein n=1 Tax=Coniosporium apollinis TaxID=61459 RepID=A0ABQ9P398_9PEZI|nr:hypothetical protein H2201_000895 [Coniosporium apollinis]
MAKPVIGYPRLSNYMGQFPEVAILRRFGNLGAQNLLYLQCELVHLEHQLRQVELADNQSNVGQKSQYAVDWFYLSQSGLESDRQQLDLFLKIRKRLREYNEAVIQQAAIAALPEPSAYDLNDLQRFLERPDMGPVALDGLDSLVWGSTTDPDSRASDLISLRGRHDEDSFSKWATEKATVRIFRWFGHKFTTPHPHYGEVVCNDRDVLEVTRIITSVFASLLPVASTVVLYIVGSMAARLGIIAAFSVVFAVSLCRLTTARTSEIFAATAAFAAVQVVFVGTNGPHTGASS